jgi:RND family efflux transporter MFP subunit
MRKVGVLVVVAVALLGTAVWLAARRSSAPPDAGAPQRGPGASAFARPPMTVELARVTRGDLSEHLTLVGNLIGAATVEVAPKVAGRLDAVTVRLGDRVSEGQVVARVEDSEVREQVAQAEASFEVAGATIRQREADLKFAETSLARSRNLYQRQLLPRQTLDDNEARHQSAVAQLDLARAQYNQARARLEELRITRRNTTIVSPVNGFVGRRHLDPGAYASSTSPIVSLVDIHLVRLVVNLVERDLRRVSKGTEAAVRVDAFPSETFQGRVARIAPVLDPATRTAEIEIEIPNPDFRLKPGMYARVALMTARRAEALVIPRNALVDVDGRRGVMRPARREGGTPPGSPGGRAPMVARFVAIETGIEEGDRIEVVRGLREGETVVTTGVTGMRDGDPLLVGEGAGGPPESSRR